VPFQTYDAQTKKVFLKMTILLN